MAETIKLEPEGGIVTFRSDSEPNPPKLTVNTGGEDYFTVQSLSDDVVQLIFPRTHRHRTFDITVTSQTPSDPEYESTATVTSAYTIDHAMLELAKTPKIETLTYRVVEESKKTDIKPMGSAALANDIVMCKLNTNELEIVKNSEWSLAKYPKDTWQPIGVVVVPGTHGVLKDGTGTVNQCGVMSIVGMNDKDPDNGGGNRSIYFGASIIDSSGSGDGLGRYDSLSNGPESHEYIIVVVGSTPLLYKSSNAYLPLQSSVGNVPKYLSDSIYYGHAPSPYSGSDLMSGGYNSIYGSTAYDTASNKNTLADFRGIVNTKILTDRSTGVDWRSLSSFYDYAYASQANVYPAACCCARYKTVGTKAFKDCSNAELKNGTGFWYLPSAGELSYILPKFSDINQTIDTLKNAYGIGDKLPSYGWFISSTKGKTHCSIVCANLGELHTDYSSNYNGVRAFMRL